MSCERNALATYHEYYCKDAQSLGCRRLRLLSGMSNVGFRVVRDAFLEEVCFSLQRDHVHEVEWVGGVVHLVIAKRD